MLPQTSPTEDYTVRDVVLAKQTNRESTLRAPGVARQAQAPCDPPQPQEHSSTTQPTLGRYVSLTLAA